MDADHLTLQSTSITANSAPNGGGGGIFDDSGASSVALVGTNQIFSNSGGNCAPAVTVDGCTG